MPKPTIFDDEIAEETTAQYSAILKDEDDNVIPAASLASFTLTLYVKDVGGTTIINGRDGQDVLNANNVVVDAFGAVLWTMQVADNAIQNSALDYERHYALWEFTWTRGGGGTGLGRHEVVFIIRNLVKVP